VHYYDRKKSHTNGGFIRIWNEGTSEFRQFEFHIALLDFNKMFKAIAGEKISSRGNFFNAYGYSNLNITGRDLDSISCPVPNNGTDELCANQYWKEN
jgi:hypothetical protein